MKSVMAVVISDAQIFCIWPTILAAASCAAPSLTEIVGPDKIIQASQMHLKQFEPDGKKS
jgi:hypothetical protein